MSSIEYKYLEEYQNKFNKILDYHLIDDSKLKDIMLYEGVYDHLFQENLSKIVRSINTIGFKEWVRNINVIGTPSAYGIVMQAEDVNHNALFVLKVSKDNSKESVDDMVHEAFIGIYALNNMRKYVPNFTYTYGMLSCTKPNLNGKEVLTWCTPNQQPNYLILENIKNATSFSKFVETCTKDEYFEVYLQVLNALNAANTEYDFTHYDLHDENVMVRRLKNKIAIKLYNSEKYIITNLVAFIIDYGQSFVNYNGTPLGFKHIKSMCCSPNPAIDAHKLLLFSTKSLLDVYNNNFIVELNKVYKFFDKNKSILDRINIWKNDKNDYFEYESSWIPNYNHSMLINYIEKNINITFIKNNSSGYKVASCGNDCLFDIDSIQNSKMVHLCPHMNEIDKIKKIQTYDYNTVLQLYEKVSNLTYDYLTNECKSIDKNKIMYIVDNCLKKLYALFSMTKNKEYKDNLKTYYDYLILLKSKLEIY